MVGQKIQTIVEKVVTGGDGLAHLPDGRVLFVPFSLPGEKLDVEIMQEKKDYAVGRIEGIIEASRDRVPPMCKHFGRCGGCQLQHVSYKAEIEIKRTYLSEILKRQAGVDIIPESIHPSLREWEYRMKSEHPAAPSDSAKDLKLGYYQRRSHEVVDIEECPVLSKEMFRDLEGIRELLRETKESAYDESTSLGNLRYVILRSTSEGKRMIGLVTFGKELRGKTVVGLVRDMGNVAGVVQNYNPYPVNRILGKKTEVISGLDHLVEKVDGLEFKVSFSSFFQANHSQAECIVKLTREFLNPSPDEILVDAYAGVGMIGLALASGVKELTAIEAEASSVADGKRNTERNELTNVRWLHAEAGQALSELEFNLVVLDPPRKGLTTDVIEAVSKKKPARICYVSCNPATWARDVKSLKDSNYTVKRLAVVDMFPRTAHLELVSLLETS